MHSFDEMMENLHYWVSLAPEVRIVRTPVQFGLMRDVPDQDTHPYLAYMCKASGGVPAGMPFITISHTQILDIMHAASFFSDYLVKSITGEEVERDYKAGLWVVETPEIRDVIYAVRPVLRLDASSGVVRGLISDGSSTWRACAQAFTPPSIFTIPEVAEQISAHMIEFAPGLHRTLDGTLIVYDEGFDSWRQVSPHDPEGVRCWLEACGCVRPDAPLTELIKAALPIVGLDGTMSLMNQLVNGDDEMSESEDDEHLWDRWGHHIFDKAPTTAITVVDPEAETMVFTATNADVFPDIWDEIVTRAKKTGVRFMIIQNTPTVLRDAATGHNIETVSGFMVAADGLAPINVSRLKEAFLSTLPEGADATMISHMIFRPFGPLTT